MKVYVCYDDYDYYGPDPLPEPYVFASEASARRRIAEYVESRKRPVHMRKWDKSGYGMCYFEVCEVTP